MKKPTSKQDNHCPTCGQETSKNGHLCAPVGGEDRCDWCGAIIPNQRHLCSEKVLRLTHICNSCGRTAVHGYHLCRPEKIS